MIQLRRLFEQEELDIDPSINQDYQIPGDAEEEDSDNIEFDEEAFEETFDENLIEELIELVGSEEEVEEAAELCYNELMAAFQNNEIELEDENIIPENLAFSALVVKLVELGKLDPDDAEGFLEDYFG